MTKRKVRYNNIEGETKLVGNLYLDKGDFGSVKEVPKSIKVIVEY